jgi:hypothetical protein
VGSLDLWWHPEAIQTSGTWAFVALEQCGLWIVDVSDPTEPEQRSSFRTGGLTLDVCLSGNLAYIADFSSLEIVDMTNPSSPRHHGAFTGTSGHERAVGVSGDLAYIAYFYPTPEDRLGGLQIVDVADPRRPMTRGRYRLLDFGTDVRVSDDLIFLTAFELGLWIMRYTGNSTPRAPSNLVATVASWSEIHLTWQDNSSNEDEFAVERRNGSSDSWVQIGTAGRNRTIYGDRFLAADTSYTYRVRARNSIGLSPYSNEAHGRTLQATVARPAWQYYK